MPPNDQTIVFDASVVLAIVLREAGHERVVELQNIAIVSSVNMAEVQSRLIDRGYGRNEMESVFGRIRMQTVVFDAELATLSAELRLKTRAFGLSLGDRACLALAMQRDGIVYTSDRIWAKIELPVEIRLTR